MDYKINWMRNVMGRNFTTYGTMHGFWYKMFWDSY